MATLDADRREALALMDAGIVYTHDVSKEWLLS